ncbi:MAG TPA: prephenate dehydrogenase/arogenate dehydrogenase family protein [Bryobacteraceae bacterium]|jgi:prephenate dehydrogenase|nr:prephenate dehydrogenase/arogenate dehydrogenase family protein [Bryobacteraceae bacterium]
MKTVAIVGVGLIGGSFALALRKAGFAGDILGVSSRKAIDTAREAGVIDHGVPLEEAAEADLVYLAQPVDRILDTLATLGPIAVPSCLITDAGSTKAAIVRQAAAHVRSARFLGGHPMAGKESRGVESAEPGLFAGRPYVLMPFEGSDDCPEAKFAGWLNRMGARVLTMTPEQHDAAVAWSSHLPQLLSTALSLALSRAANPDIERVAGAGLIDMTRLALSSADLWRSILETNSEPVLEALNALIGQLTNIKIHLQDDKLVTLWGESSTFARYLRRQAN